MKVFKSLLPTVFSLFLFIASCCITDPEDKVPPKPHGYQENIPWPSLADSPWPMDHHDPQSTGRSQYSGPVNGQILNEFSTYYGSSNSQCGIMLDHDPNIYVTNGAGTEVGLLIIRNNTSPELLFNAGSSHYENYTTPLLRSDSTIVFTYSRQYIYAITLDGTLIWEFNVGKRKILNLATLPIDIVGNIYFTTLEAELYCLSSEGELKWIYKDEKIFNSLSRIHNLSFSPDGKFLYLPGKQESLLAFNIYDREIKWMYGTLNLRQGAVVDSYGRVYLFMERGNVNCELVCLNENGQVIWKFYTPLGRISDNTPAIDKYGNICIATDTLYSVNYSGLLNWKQSMEGFCEAPIIIDGNSNVLVSTRLHGNGGINIYSFSQHGELNWKIHYDTFEMIGGSPALSNTGILYYPIHPGRIITIN
ncbi:PQQ-binding-like beta-propeller repeat protein [Bacteroidota bacterium]